MSIRLIETKDLSHEEWQNIRLTGIGSSEAAAACGLNPYMSMLALWMIKTKRTEPHALSPQSTGHQPLYWGQQLEPLVARHYQLTTGHKVRRVNAILQHPQYPFMLANLDYQIVGVKDVHILECKTAGEHGVKLWRDGVPLYVLCQVQHQLAVTGKKGAHVCVLLCGHEVKLFYIERNDVVIQQLIEAEKIFWGYVQRDEVPPPDASASAAQALQQLYPTHQPLTACDATHDSEVNEVFEKLVSAKQKIEHYQTVFDENKHLLQAKMQAHERLQLQGGSITWKRSKDTKTLDTKALLKAHPEYLEKFSQVRQGTRRFNIHT